MRRAGKPWRVGNGKPFIAVAISAVRPSRATSVGIPAMNPSTEWLKICVASALTPACSRTVLGECLATRHYRRDLHQPRSTHMRSSRLDGGRLFNEFFIGKRKWCVDHSVDGERPLVRVNFRNNERSIDAVKLSFGVMYGVMPSMLSNVAASTVVPLVGAGSGEGLWRTGDCTSAHNLGDAHRPCGTDDRCARNGHKPTSVAERSAGISMSSCSVWSEWLSETRWRWSIDPRRVRRERNDPNGGVSKWPGDVHKETDEAYRCGEDSEMLT